MGWRGEHLGSALAEDRHQVGGQGPRDLPLPARTWVPRVEKVSWEQHT